MDFEISPDAVPIPNSHEYDTKVDVEAEGINERDGTPIEVLLFHRNGKLRGLEFVVYGEPFLEVPDASKLRLSFNG